MLISILFMFKTLIYMNLTGVQFNKTPVFLITSMLTLLIFSLIYRSNWRYKNIMALGFYSIVSLIMFVDVIYYSQFAALPSVIMLSQTKQLGAVRDSIRSLIELKNLLLILDIPILIFLFRFIRKKDLQIPKLNISKNTIPLTLLGIVVLTIGYVVVIDQSQSVMAQEFYSFHGRDIVQSFSEDPSVEVRARLTEEDLIDLENRTKVPEGKLTGLGKDKNLIVLQIESLQEFVVNLEYEGQEITPNFNKLIRDDSTIYYDEYYQLLGRGNTSDTEFVSHNSFHPSMGEPSYVEYEKNTFYGLPWLLRDNGYSAWAFHGYEKDFWNREKAYVNQGFERFISQEDYDFTETIGFGLRDEDFFQQSLDYLKELDELDDNPFYAFLVTLTSHAPYKMEDQYQDLTLKEEDKDTLLGDYLQSIHYTDKHLGEFIDNLKEEGLYDNSVIAIYGDHFAISNTQEDIKKSMSHFLGEEYDFDRMMNIPLTITIPGEDINHVNSQIGSPLDFYPTMINIMGYENKKGLIFGRDLNNFQGDNFIAPQTYMLKGSFLDKDTLFVMSRDGIFEHSRARDMKTRESLDVEKFRDQYERAIGEINKSDFILNNDLLKEYMANKGEVDLNNNGNMEIGNKDQIRKKPYASLEDLDKSYDKGYRIMSLDLKLEDDQVVLEDENAQFTIKELVKWTEEKEDAYIVLQTREDKKIFEKIKRDYEEILDKFIPEILSFDDYMPVTYKGFSNAILNLKNGDYSEKEILDFLNRHSSFGVTISKEQLDSGLGKKIRELGVNPYLDSISNKRQLKRLKKKGVFGGFIE